MNFALGLRVGALFLMGAVGCAQVIGIEEPPAGNLTELCQCPRISVYGGGDSDPVASECSGKLGELNEDQRFTYAEEGCAEFNCDDAPSCHQKALALTDTNGIKGNGDACDSSFQCTSVACAAVFGGEGDGECNAACRDCLDVVSCVDSLSGDDNPGPCVIDLCIEVKELVQAKCEAICFSDPFDKNDCEDCVTTHCTLKRE